MLFFILRFLGQGTRKRALGLIGLATFVVLAGGVAFALVEHLSVWMGWYWAVTTATTVGYGDVTPHTTAGHVIAVVVMLSTIPLLGAVFALWSGAAAAARLRRLMHMGRPFPPGRFRIVVGMHAVVPATLDELVRMGEDVVLVADVDPAGVSPEVHLVRGDPTSLHALRTARPEKAAHALVTGESDGDVLVSTVLLRQCARELEMTALVHARAAAEALKDLGVAVTISADDLLSHTLAKVLESPHAGTFLVELLDSERHRLDELTATPEMVGRPLSSLRAERDDLVLGLVHDERVSLGIGEDPTVAAGDRLLVARPTAS
ncbi:MAG TPA: ion channel [Acidimicrobiales bacterium]|nr:ion channel [Acidimicrobiales bacterium]